MTIIYFFILAEYVYVGKHEAVGCDGWPTEGKGRLPDGYGGSGQFWQNVCNKHGIENAQWRKLEVCGDNWPEREVYWVAWARQTYGKKCTNICNGGKGADPSRARDIVGTLNGGLSQEQRTASAKHAARISHEKFTPEQRREKAARGAATRKFLATLPPEERERIRKERRAEQVKAHHARQAKLRKGKWGSKGMKLVDIPENNLPDHLRKSLDLASIGDTNAGHQVPDPCGA